MYRNVFKGVKIWGKGNFDIGIQNGILTYKYQRGELGLMGGKGIEPLQFHIRATLILSFFTMSNL